MDQIPGRLLIEIEKGHDKQSFMKAVGGGVTTRTEHKYQLFNGLTVDLHDLDNAGEKAKEIAQMPFVKNTWTVRRVEAPDISNVKVIGTPKGRKMAARGNEAADTFSPHVMTQVDKLRAKGLTGDGYKIALVDTGIDYTHPDLGNGCFGRPHCIVSFGRDFVGDAFTGDNEPVPGKTPKDCGGHGTHLAGIVAAQKNALGFTGAAPGVKLGAYRIFGCSGTTTTDLVVAALNKAFEDGAHIIATTAEVRTGWASDVAAVVASRIVEQGVPVIASAGNDGDSGLFYAASPASAKGVIAVASYDSVMVPVMSYHSKYSIDGGSKVDFTHTPWELPWDPTGWDVSMPLYATSYDATIANDACDPLPVNTPDLSKYIVLVRRGTCIFAQKVHNVAAKGAKYILFYNNNVGTFEADVGDEGFNIKAAGMVTRQVGESWVKTLKARSSITLDVTGRGKAKFDVSYYNSNETGGAVSSYTSWGPTWSMDSKPQLGAPGGGIISTWAVAKGSYAVMSGTSAASPLVAAIIALVAQARGTLEPELITDLLSATAKPQLFNNGTHFFGKLAPAAQQGGGIVQAYDAAYTTSLLYPYSLSFNDTDHFATNLNFTISNKGKKSVTYKICHVPAMTMYTLEKNSVYPMAFPNEAVDSQATLSFSKDSVTLAPGERASISVCPKAPCCLDARRLPLWSGYITVSGTDGSALSLPYQGLVGSLRRATVLMPDQCWVTLSNDTTLAKSPKDSKFVVPAPGTFKDDDVVPTVYAKLALGSALIRVDIVPMTTPPPKDLTTEFMGVKTIGQPFEMPALFNQRGDFQQLWNGKLDSGRYAPAGKYKFVTRALKISGDARNEKDWDVASTESFYLEYKKK